MSTVKPAKERNRKIIDAIIKKAQQVCPGSLALIGVYGSVHTGDVHTKSDLDLLILINDEAGYKLASGFILDDTEIGYDLYCTTWESLEEDAAFTHPHLGKLMDSEIVYCADDAYLERLQALRKSVSEKLAAPFTFADFRNAYQALKDAEHYYFLAMTSEEISEVRKYAGAALYYIEDSLALLNRQYFRMSVRKIYEELSGYDFTPNNIDSLIENVVSATSVSVLQDQLTQLIKKTRATFDSKYKTIGIARKVPEKDALVGTYEEMVSNWRGKMHLAAQTNNCHLAFMSLVNFDSMLSDIRRESGIPELDVMAVYDPRDLEKTARDFDRLLDEYLKEYKKTGITVKRYPDLNAFIKDYLKEE